MVGDTLDEDQFMTVASNELNSYIYDRHQARHSTCAMAWWRHWLCLIGIGR